MNNIINKVSKIDFVKTFDGLNPHTQDNLVTMFAIWAGTKLIMHVYDSDKFQNLVFKVTNKVDIEINAQNQSKKLATAS